MEYRRLGKSGLQLSVFSFGSWVTFSRQINTDLAVEMMALAYDRGVNFFDNAEGYEAGDSEEVMGDALSRLAWPRDRYCVSSKVFFGGKQPTQRGLSRKHVTDACHAALKRLKVDYLDLYFCHRPDYNTPIEETVRAMHALVQQGKVLYWGTSEWSAQQLSEAHGIARELHLTPPSMEQPEYNLFHRERVEIEYAPLYESMGLGTTIWSPLASGVLTGKYAQGIPEDSRLGMPGYEWLREQFETDEGRDRISRAVRLQELAASACLSLHHMALLWCLHNPNVSTVILGASKREQLEDNLDALNHADHITPELMEKIEDVLQNRPQPPQQF